MKKLILLFFIFAVLSPSAFANSKFLIITPMSKEESAIIQEIQKRQALAGSAGDVNAQLDSRNQWLFFSSKVKSSQGNNDFQVSTLFSNNPSTIRKRVMMQQGHDQVAFNVVFDNRGRAFRQSVHMTPLGEALFYERDGETFIYTQTSSPKGKNIELKEWIYEKKPNCTNGSQFLWRFQPDLFQWPIVTRRENDGSLNVLRRMPINGISPHDEEKRRHVVDLVHKVVDGKINFKDEQELATVPPAVFWNNEGLKGNAQLDAADNGQLLLTLKAPASEYPLLIDPTLKYGQWLGPAGSSADEILAMAVADINDVYAGGLITGSKTYLNTTFQGTLNVGQEGFVISISDAATPTLNWGQWLGGNGTTNEVTALAVSGTTVYAGGLTSASTNWETITWQGTWNGGADQGFVTAITTGNSPSLAWGQWLGGIIFDDVTALAVSGTTVYVGGYSQGSTNWDTVIWQGTWNGGYEQGYVVAISTGNSPSLAWGQWLGGSGGSAITLLNALAVSGTTLYAGGYTNGSTNWDTVTWKGTWQNPGIGTPEQGYVVAISTGNSPSLAWGQWLGANSTLNTVTALAVSGTTVDAAGYSNSPTNWETVTFQGTSHASARVNNGWVVAITTGNSPSLAWGQWLGGTGSTTVPSLVVSGTTVYASGTTALSTSWETMTWHGTWNGANQGYVVAITTGNSPSLAWGQWLGGSVASTTPLALTVSGTTLYSGGWSNGSTNWDTVTFQGTFPSGTAGFVTAITTGNSPSLGWGEWISGGAATSSISALAVSGSTVYAGGTASASFSEAVNFQGTFNGSASAAGASASFVVSMTDGGTPQLNWGQWLGGNGATNTLTSLAVSGTTVYAGGYSTASTNWETVSWQGTWNGGSSQGWVTAITTGNSPSLAWGQWLGGSNPTNQVDVLAVSGTTLYAGGETQGTANWDTVTWNGTFTAGNEGYVTAITTGNSPSLAWGQWLGGGGLIDALAISGATVYAGGYAESTAGYGTTTFQGTMASVSENGLVVAITSGSSPVLAWGQWMGGTANYSVVNALTVSGTTVYTGGYTDSSNSWSGVTWQGTWNGGASSFQGYVLAVTTGNSPSLAWGQWLGGGGGVSTVVNALAVSGTTLYAGGYTGTSTNWDTVTWNGTWNGGTFEGYVVAMTTGNSPSLAWGQWLGGSTGTGNQVSAFAINGSSVYCGGFSNAWNTGIVTFQGTFAASGSEAFVVNINNPTGSGGSTNSNSSTDTIFYGSDF